jgi:hypothetical protein
MRRINFLCLVVLIAALPYTSAAPAPKRTNAKPAVINAGTEIHVKWVQERLVSCAHIAILQDKKVAELAIVRRHVSDPKDTKELVSWLEKNFRIERERDTNRLRVSFQDGNAKEQAAIINVVVDDFLKSAVGKRIETEKSIIERHKVILEKARRAGKITAEDAAKTEEAIKKREERIKTFPALVEQAKAP